MRNNVLIKKSCIGQSLPGQIMIILSIPLTVCPAPAKYGADNYG
jgi:hypothetical protein